MIFRSKANAGFDGSVKTGDRPRQVNGMIRLTRSDIEAVRNISIAKVLTECGIEVRNNKAVCPFHDDHRPSLSVHPKKNIWHCFACGDGGDAIDFVRRLYGFRFAEAVRWLNGRFGMGLALDKAPTLAECRREDHRRTQKHIREAMKKRFLKTEIGLRTEFHKLRRIISGYDPPQGTDIADFPQEYIDALSRIDIVEHWLDVMQDGDDGDKDALAEYLERRRKND